MKLVITEKPSVAMSIAKVIGAGARRDGWMEGGGYLVSWCVGHLVELSPPESYDERYRKWRYEDLPIIPEEWQYQVSASTEKQFGILKKLMERQDVTSLVCATDAGREGELIFRLVYQESGCRKPFERLWISSMEDAAIREGFANLKPGTEYDLLCEAALCRERAVYELIAGRLICAVGEPYRYPEVTIEAACAGAAFTIRGRTVIDEGWKRYDVNSGRDKKDPWRIPDRGKANESADAGEDGQDFDAADIALPAVSEGMELPVLETAMKEGRTSPPKRFTEDLLLQAMETASADEFPAEVERKGIGTPATRAAIIEKLVKKGFIERRGDKKTRYLCATDKGNALVTVLPEQLQSPSMTAEWEEKLLRVGHGELESGEFMQEIMSVTPDLVQNDEAVKDADVLIRPKGKVIGSCPACGSDVVESQKGWFCSNRNCRFALWRENRFFASLGKSMTTGRSPSASYRPFRMKMLRSSRSIAAGRNPTAIHQSGSRLPPALCSRHDSRHFRWFAPRFATFATFV